MRDLFWSLNVFGNVYNLKKKNNINVDLCVTSSLDGCYRILNNKPLWINSMWS